MAIYVIADHTTPKFSVGGVSFTLNSRDYKSPVCVYDARGNGNGKIVPTLTGDHANRITDYTAIVCVQKNSKQQGSDNDCLIRE